MGLISSNEFRFLQSLTKNKMVQPADQTTKEMETLNFIFSASEMEESNNGHYFNQIYLPEEIIILIFTYVPPSDILKLGLVCKKWYNILKMHTLWTTMYIRKYNKMPKPLPWYTFYALFNTPKYFDGNLLKNNCGQEKFNHWTILKNGGNKFKVEKKPVGSDPYALECPDFDKATSCFVTSYGLCQKVQDIPLSCNLINYIVRNHKPHIYTSEWVAGRFDCGGTYALKVKLYSNSGFNISKGSEDYDENSEDEFYFQPEEENKLHVETIVMEKKEEFVYNGNEATKWKKVEVILKDYADVVAGIIFEHAGVDNQFWHGHYGPKMAGGVVRLLFDSMEPDLIQNTSNESDEEIN